ncbi:hypothetical protein OS493_004630 [Desmophyllum pertusum]|uniref:Uncharacterized protein n=1 Tax=Desmophyllum pertusum TaxID=174260 RepID=A0A9W9ZHF1_9CNID|nr:hypothetical protein OS493_004630 [Desmophyllum pertusum]
MTAMKLSERKTEDYCSQRLEDILPGTSDDDVIIIEDSQETSQGGSTTVLGNSELKRKKTEAVVSEFEHNNKGMSCIGRHSVDSVSDDEVMASEKMEISGSDEEGDAHVEDGCDVSIVSENQEAPGRKRDGRNDSYTYTEGTNDVTKVIVALWMEYKGKRRKEKEKEKEKEKSEKTGSTDLTMGLRKREACTFYHRSVEGDRRKRLQCTLESLLSAFHESSCDAVLHHYKESRYQLSAPS